MENLLMVQEKIASYAKRYPMVEVLNQHITVSLLKEAYRMTRKDGAVGVDGVTAEDYERNLEENLSNLVELCKSGRYYAPPVRRVYIPKNKTEKRPLGIPTFEDKILQRAIGMLLEPIYEQIFFNCSYGFRPNRSAHKCIKALTQKLYEYQGGYVIDVDIKKYFDTIPKGQIRSILQERVRDNVIHRMIGKWLNAGVLEDRKLTYSETGTPQGGVISPMLANIFLHEALDKWFYESVIPAIDHEAELFRFADDFIIICRNKNDAERIMKVLPKRLGKFGLTVNEKKTRLIDFRRPGKGEKGASFDFLGFTFYWGTSREGNKCVKLKTAKKKFARMCLNLNNTCKKILHYPLAEQLKIINSKLRGHHQYFGVSFNSEELMKINRIAERSWFKWLNRRSQKRNLNWERYKKIMSKFPFVTPRIYVKLFPLFS